MVDREPWDSDVTMLVIAAAAAAAVLLSRLLVSTEPQS